MGGNSKRGDVCVCIADALCRAAEENTALYSNNTTIKIHFKNVLPEFKPLAHSVDLMVINRDKPAGATAMMCYE